MSDNWDENQSIWSLVRGRGDVLYFEHDDTEQRIEKRRKITSTKGFGVGCEWITYPLSWCGTHGFDWSSADEYFKGASIEKFSEVERQWQEAKEKGANSDDERAPAIDTYHQTIAYPNEMFGEASGLPSSSEIEGMYDIIYYGGLLDYLVKNSRTARGTLELACVTENGRATSYLSGKVTMHPCMDEIDVVPFGGNFSFRETKSVQRRAYAEVEDKQPPKSTGVIQIKVTDPPVGMTPAFVHRHEGASIYTVEGKREFTGEMRFFKEKTGTGIAREYSKDFDFFPSSASKFNSVEEAEALNKAHYEKTCSWLHKHTILPKVATSKVGEFLCPPPVFFFEPGDICIDIEWHSTMYGFSSSNSCLIARRRTNSDNRASSTMPLTFAQQYGREMRRLEVAIEELQLQKDLTWLAFKCHRMVATNDKNCSRPSDGTVDLRFTHDDTEDYDRVWRCLAHLNENFFNEKLSVYGLRLESMSKEYLPRPSPSHVAHQLRFSQI